MATKAEILQSKIDELGRSLASSHLQTQQLWQTVHALSARLAKLEKHVEGVADVALEIGKNAAPIATVRRLADAPQLPAVVAPGMRLIGRTETGAPIVEAIPPARPAVDATWRPNPNSKDPEERALAESFANDGQGHRRPVESNGIDSALAMQSELHTTYRKQGA